MHDFGNWAGENVMLMVRALSLSMGLMIVVSIQEACAEPVTLTLSCDGTLTNMMSTSDSDNKTEAFTKMGLLVNLAEGTVLGFTPAARIKKTDAVSVEFAGENRRRVRVRHNRSHNG